MAERPHDLIDVLRAAESERERTLHGTATDDVLHRTHGALRAARARRTVLTSVGAAAAVAVVVTGVAVWAPGPVTQPAGPSPSVAPSSTAASIPGIPPLRQATEEEVRDAPEGSSLVLWDQSTQRQVEYRRDIPLGHDAYLLLVRPDGEVVQVARAPQGAEILTGWDRGAATVTLVVFTGPEVWHNDGTAQWSERDQEHVVVDLLTGRVIATADDPAPDPDLSPDGRSALRTDLAPGEGAQTVVAGPEGEVVLSLPGRCSVSTWVDDTHLLGVCTGTSGTDGPPTSKLLIVDATTGVVTQERQLGTDEGRATSDVLQVPDGRLLLLLDMSTAEHPSCGTRLSVVDGLDLTPLAVVPAGAGELLSAPSIAGGNVLVAGRPGCTSTTRPGVWSVDVATEQVDELIRPSDDPDEPMGVLSVVTPG